MKKVSLFLLAVNLIIGLWLYTSLSQPKFTKEEKEQQKIAQTEQIITLDEMGVEVSAETIEAPSEEVVELASAQNITQVPEVTDSQDFAVDQEDRLADNSEGSSVLSADQNLQQSVENLQENVETTVKETISFIGNVIDDIELPEAPTPHCYTLGPFAESGAAESVAQSLQGQNVQVVTSLTERHEPGGYWVYIPSDGLRSARKQIAELKQRGIKDVGLSSQQGVRHWVSLGVYSTKVRAQRRQVALSNIGFYTRMEQRALKIPEHWIDITLSPEQELDLVDSVRLDSWPDLKETFCREAGNL